MTIFNPGMALIGRKPSAAAASTDPFFANVTLLLHGNGADGGTTITDSSSVANTMTPHGNAQTSTGQIKYGSASLKFDGTGDYIDTPYVTGNFDWWVSDYTIEAWVYYTTFTDASTLVTFESPGMIGNMDAAGSAASWTFGPDQNGKLSLRYYNGSANGVTSSGSISLNTWTHIALCQSGGNITLFIGGTAETPVAVSGTPQSSIGQNLTICRTLIGGNGPTGWIDDMRITKGTARYSGNFTPSTVQFPDS